MNESSAEPKPTLLYVLTEIPPPVQVFYAAPTAAVGPGVYLRGVPENDPWIRAAQGPITYASRTFTIEPGETPSLTYTYSSGATAITSSKAIDPTQSIPIVDEHTGVVSTEKLSETSPTTETSSIPQSVTPVPTSTRSSDIPRSTVAPKPETSRPGIQPGPVAGIAIACIIAGALIAGLIAWFCLGKSRKSRRSHDHEASSLALIHPREKGATVKAVPMGSVSPLSQDLSSVLPQPLEDKALSSGFSGIGLAIKNHVQSYYHSSRVSPGLLDLDDLQSLGKDLPISTGTLSTLLGNPDTRELALRFCIAWVLITRIHPSSGPDTTLLPPEISQCLQSIAFIDRSSRSQVQLLAKWRAISAELMQSSYVRNPFSASDSRHQNVEKAVSVLGGVLRPYADSRLDNNQRLQNLREIFKRAANFAFTLFSQPSTWDFDWQVQQGVQSGSLCIYPALVQTADETGEPVKPPRAFSEATVRRLDG